MTDAAHPDPVNSGSGAPDPGQAPANPGTSADPTKAAAPQEPAKPIVPEKYEFKLAEGRALDEGLMSNMTPLFKEFGLTQEMASKLVDAYDKYGVEFEKTQEKQFQDFMADLTKKNLEAIRKEWGADYEGNLNVAQRGIGRFLSDAAKKKLEDSGLGNDPEFLKAFLQIGKMVQEDRPPNGQSPAGTRRPLGEILYPSTTQ